jgi:hypothetical protein
VVVLCDISGSVAEFARFTLMLLHALQSELAGLRSFVFVDGVAEVTDLMARSDVELDPRLLLTLPGVVVGDGHSDYRQVFERVVEVHGDALTPASTVLVTGDARTNHRPDGAEALRELRRRTRRVYWLDPEPQADWTEGDSALVRYRPSCDGVFEVRTLAQLARAVEAIL